MHGIGTAGLVGEPDRARAVEHVDLAARLRDFERGQRGRRRRHVEQHFDTLIVEHVAGDVGGKIGLVEMIGRDDLDLAAEHLAAEIFHRHFRSHLAAGPGDVGVETGHIEDAAELERRLCLRQRRGGRHRQCAAKMPATTRFMKASLSAALPAASFLLPRSCRMAPTAARRAAGAARMRFSAKRNASWRSDGFIASRRHACAWLSG